MIPSSNITIEPEFYQMAPHGVSTHITRLTLHESTPDDLERMAGEAGSASELLATASVNIIGYGCTVGSLLKGSLWDLNIAKQIQMATGLPAVTTATAVIEAFRAFGIRRAAVATPYNSELNLLVKRYLEHNGIKVVELTALGLSDSNRWHFQPLEATYRLAKKADRPDAEGLFISCTDLKSVGVLARLEKELGKPVFSSNISLLWAILRRLRIPHSTDRYGSLLKRQS